MFGQISRPSGTVPRRSRQRVVLVVVGLLVLALVLGEVIDQVVDSYGPSGRRALAAWEAGIAPIISQSNGLGALLRTARNDAPSQTRTALDGELDMLVASSAREQSAAAGLGIRAPSSAVGRLLGAVLATRAAALRSFTGAIALATGPDHDLAGATRSLVVVGSKAELADRDYRSVLALVRDAGGRGVLPSAGWSEPRTRWTTSASAQYAAALGHATALVQRRQLAIVAVSIEPNPVRIVGLPDVAFVAPPASIASSLTTTTSLAGGTSTSGPTGSAGPSAVTGPSGATVLGSTTTNPVVSSTTTTLLPPPSTLQVPPAGSQSYLLPTGTISVSVVLANSGDIALRGVEVTAVLAPRPRGTGAVSPRSVAVRIGSVGSGASRYVVLPTIAVSSATRNFALTVRITATATAPASDSIALVTSASTKH